VALEPLQAVVLAMMLSTVMALLLFAFTYDTAVAFHLDSFGSCWDCGINAASHVLECI